MNMQKTLKPYLAGFAFSAALTLTAYFLVAVHWASRGGVFSKPFLIGVVMTLAMTQLLVQLIFFLRLGKESKPHWNTVIFLATFLVLLIIVLASIWIINHLNNNMLMNPEDLNAYLNQQG